MAEILGSGVAFPLQVDRRGGIALAVATRPTSIRRST